MLNHGLLLLQERREKTDTGMDGLAGSRGRPDSKTGFKKKRKKKKEKKKKKKKCMGEGVARKKQEKMGINHDDSQVTHGVGASKCLFCNDRYSAYTTRFKSIPQPGPPTRWWFTMETPRDS
ncbi:uncharacterized protein MONBRDRAFT_24560 [Monosiga brevicollis MX1]|uniref:Uncharacterized protein n=1 Tax=Monosiga brevicollis TaxID=81824 RepID=A9UWT4_MONBE|nr:uncharacterized protein MONBRDRAFT_24560 [Monosiga brevicollis MX1]EDQ90271.1 predicted protein [Monosiga brevicollis MX1]|eukprot:XP_001745038.1 hypothetical protein [Monosiga brevicollis MX1]